MVLALVTPVVLTPSAAKASTDLITESFTDSSVTDPAWTVLSNPTAGALGLPCLTAAVTTPAASSIPDCATGQVAIPAAGDGDGNGVLRLTDNGGQEAGAVLYNKALPLTQGADISFDFAMYGKTSDIAADGIGVFLANGSAPITATGAAGGSLGYAQKANVTGAAPGVTNGFLGLGLDERGNYELDTEGRGTTGGSATTSGTSACTPTPSQVAAGGTPTLNEVGLRGPGTGYGNGTNDSYCLLDNAALNQTTQSLHGAGPTRADANTLGTVRIVVDPSSAANPKVTVFLAFNQTLNDTVPLAQVFQTPEPPNAPTTFRFGITASTGGRNDIHEIRKLVVRTALTEPSYSLAQSAAANPSIPAGGSGTLVLTPTLVSGSPDPLAPTVTETLPAGLTLASVPTPTGYTCTGTVGSQTVSCTYTGTLPIAVGTTLPPITVAVTAGTATGQVTASGIASSNDSTNDTAGTATISIAPVAIPDAVTVPDGQTKNGTVPTPTGTGPFTYTVVKPPADASAFSLDPTSGAFVYTPKTPFSGSGTAADAFTYTVTDGGGTSAAVTETLNVLPQAVTDSYSTTAGAGLTIPKSTGVVTNDLGSGLTATAATIPTSAGGSVALAADGSFVYTPSSPDYSGTGETFSYTVTDTSNPAQSSTIQDTITVTPTAAADSATVPYETATTPAGSLLDNDHGSGLKVTGYTQPGSGSVSVNPNGTYTYTPANNFSGTTSFSYTVTDASNQTVTASDTITVLPPGPVANADSGQTTVNQPLNNGANLLGNDRGTGPFTATKASNPKNGSVTVDPSGSYVYTPATGFSGVDTFTYTVTDVNKQTSAPGTVTITVKPKALNASIATPAGVATSTTVPTATGKGPFTYALATGAQHGTVVFDPDNKGGYTYTPDTGYLGADSFTYTATDQAGITSDAATVSITVTTPPGPTTTADAGTTPANTVLSNGPNLLTNDKGTGPLTAQDVTQPGHGKVTVDPSGTFVYTPTTGFSGVDTFLYTATDAVKQVSAQTLVTITVVPVANADSYTGTAGTPITDNVLTNDVASSTAGVPAKATLVTGPKSGTLTLNANGSFTYSANAGFTGTDTFTYFVTDSNGLVSPAATVTLTIGAPSAPKAVNDLGTTPAGQPLTNAGSVQINDSGTGVLTSSLVAQGTPNTVSLDPSGTYVYTPPAGFSGIATFTYTDSDNYKGTSNVATVTITVTPNSQSDSATLTGGSPYAGASVLTNDVGSKLTAVDVTQPAHGQVTVNPADGTYVYTPVLGYSGPDSFTYRASDGTSLSPVTSVTLDVVKPTAPVAVADAATTNVGAPLTNGTSLLANDSGDVPLTATKVTDPVNGGTVTVNPDGTYVYVPAPGFSGTDSFTYKATDPYKQSSPAVLVTVTVLPTAAPDSQTVASGSTLAAAIPTPGGTGPFTAVAVAQPAHGTLTLNPNGTYTYTPVPGFIGTDTFTYDVTDAAGGTSAVPATVTIAVTLPAAPVGTADTGATPAGVVLHGASVLGNDAGVGPLTAALAASPTHGSVVVNPDGTYTYTPAPGFSGTDVFSYIPTDRFGQAGAATAVTITVTPSAAPDSAKTPAGTTLVGSSVLANDTGLGLTAVLVKGPAHGTLTLNPNGSYTYVPAKGYVGPDTFTYVAKDANGLTSAVTTVSITVTDVVPVVESGTAQTVVTGGTLKPIVVSDPSGAKPVVTTSKPGLLPPGVKLGPSGSFVGTPTTPGTYRFPITVKGPAGSVNKTVTITVIPVAVSAVTATVIKGTTFVAPQLGGTLLGVKGALPPGVRLVNGKLVGTPTALGTYVSTVTVKIDGRVVTRRLTITVKQRPTVVVAPNQPTRPLSFTGIELGRLLALSLALIMAGAGALVIGRRRRLA